MDDVTLCSLLLRGVSNFTMKNIFIGREGLACRVTIFGVPKHFRLVSHSERRGFVMFLRNWPARMTSTC